MSRYREYLNSLIVFRLDIKFWAKLIWVGIIRLFLNDHTQCLNISNISKRSRWNLPFLIPFQYMELKPSVSELYWSPTVRVKPLRRLVVTGQILNKWLKVSLFTVSGFRMRQNVHLSLTLFQIWIATAPTRRRLFLSKKMNSLWSLERKLRFQTPSVGSKLTLSGMSRLTLRLRLLILD